MSPPTELSLEEILKFMLAHNGKVTNHELVKHFKLFLTNPDLRDEARATFKKHVNTLAIIKTQNNEKQEKCLILKKKYMQNNKVDSSPAIISPESPTIMSPENSVITDTSDLEPIPYRPPPPVQLNQDFNILNHLCQESSSTNIPPYIDPPNEQVERMDYKENIMPEEIISKVQLRQKFDKPFIENTPTKLFNLSTGSQPTTPNQDFSGLTDSFSSPLVTTKSEGTLLDTEQTISVKERKQMFNRMASEGDVIKSPVSGNLSAQDADEEDRASLDHKNEDFRTSPKQKQWILCSAKGDYHTLAKMCKENPKLTKTKDPFTNAMHWACKRGDENIVKMLAGVARHLVNEKSGYTPLHLAMQFRHENVYRLLVTVYDADPNIRDWSGRKPQQYLAHIDTSLSPGSYRKTDTYDLRRTVTTPPAIRISPCNVLSQTKKEGFLRIGSLNVRVKKTTEAFSNFLGVGATRNSAYMPKSAREREADRRSDDSDTLHKSWGSADNIQKEDKLMPPPMSSKVKRRGTSGRRGVGDHSRSTPTTPDQARAHLGVNEEVDSDSDTAAGFHSAWRASNCT